MASAVGAVFLLLMILASVPNWSVSAVGDAGPQAVSDGESQPPTESTTKNRQPFSSIEKKPWSELSKLAFDFLREQSTTGSVKIRKLAKDDVPPFVDLATKDGVFRITVTSKSSLWDAVRYVVDDEAKEEGFFLDLLDSLRDDPNGPQLDLIDVCNNYLGTEADYFVVEENQDPKLMWLLHTRRPMADLLDRFFLNTPGSTLRRLGPIKVWTNPKGKSRDDVIHFAATEDFLLISQSLETIRRVTALAAANRPKGRANSTKALEEEVTKYKALFDRVSALHESGTSGGEAYRLMKVKLAWERSEAELLFHSGDVQAAIDKYDEAIATSQQYEEAARVSYDAGSVNLDEVIKAIEIGSQLRQLLVGLRQPRHLAASDPTKAANPNPGDKPSPTETVEDEAGVGDNSNSDSSATAATVEPMLTAEVTYPNRGSYRQPFTLWRELASDEKAPSNNVNGLNGIGYYDPVIWQDKANSTRWVRFRNSATSYRDVPAGRYRITSKSALQRGNPTDPTPFAVSEPFLYDGVSEKVVKLTIQEGDRELIVTAIDQTSGNVVPKVAIRLFDPSGAPIVQGNGSGNFFERTNDVGMVVYGQLPPGTYQVQFLGMPARINEFIEYPPRKKLIDIEVTRKSQTYPLQVKPRKLSEEEIERMFPYSIEGRVTDTDGKPIPGVLVSAATGVGTLIGGGKTRTDDNGDYVLYFGGGAVIANTRHGVGTQAAHFRATKEGWQATSELGYQFWLMSDLAEGDFAQQIRDNGQVWGKDNTDEVVFANEREEVNFVLKRN